MKYRARLFATAGLVLLAGALAAAYAFFGAYASKVESVRDSIEKSRLFRFDPADVTAGEVTTDKGTVRFERSAMGWKITRPAEVAGDRAAIAKLIESIASITSNTTVELDEKNTLSKYGLLEPTIEVSLELAGGSKAQLAVGQKNDFDGRSYAKSSMIPTASLVDPSVVSQANQSFFALREKRLFDLDPREVETFEATREGKVIYALAKKGGRWHFRADSGAPEKVADQVEAVRLIDTLLTSRAGNFADDSGSDDVLSGFGLDRPVMSFAITASGARKVAVRIGTRSDASSERWYLKVEGDKSVAEVAGTLAEDLTRSAADLDDRRLFDVDESLVTGIRLAHGATTVELERNAEGGWVATGATTSKPKGYKISGIVHAIATVRATRYDTNDPIAADLARAGLRPPKTSVTIIGPKGPMGTLLIGRTAKESNKLAYAMAEGAKKVAVVELSSIDSIPEDLADLFEGR